MYTILYRSDEMLEYAKQGKIRKIMQTMPFEKHAKTWAYDMLIEFLPNDIPLPSIIASSDSELLLRWNDTYSIMRIWIDVYNKIGKLAIDDDTSIDADLDDEDDWILIMRLVEDQYQI